MYKKITIFISWIFVLIWMGVIFYMSAQVAIKSNSMSLGITDYIIRFLDKFVRSDLLHTGILNHIIRKTAHFSAYFLLGILSHNAMGRSGVRGWRRAVASILVCVVYAVSDELHQLFIPGRSGQATDVIIDSSGAALSIMLYMLVSKLIFSKVKKSTKTY